MFTIEDRERVRTAVLALASSDSRIVAAAVVGSLAVSDGDRWSDLDLTFGVAEGVPVHDVLTDWTATFVGHHGAAVLFDLPYGQTIYRVFLFPGCLQADLSFTPAADFGPLGPEFRLLFGHAVEKPTPPPPSAGELFGYAVHHVVRARVCIERGRYWQAEYWLSAARDYALSLACLTRGLAARVGRGFDALPGEVHDAFRGTFVPSLTRVDLLASLKTLIQALDGQVAATDVAGHATMASLRELVAEAPH